MAEIVDHQLAKSTLAKAWSKIEKRKVVPSDAARPLIDAIMASKDVTFKYILITGLLAKATNPAIHPRAIQTGSKLTHSYDARSLCHGVIVPFEKQQGDLFGLSNEPFVNKPARHPEHSKDNPQLRNKALATSLHDVLEKAHSAQPDEVLAMLVYTLRSGKRRAASSVVAIVAVQTTYRRVIEYVERLLEESDAGSRLAAVVAAFVRSFNHGYIVKVFPPTYSNRFARTTGDIEIRHSKNTIAAFECKHRPLSIDDVRHGVRKAKENGVAEYWFIIAAGLAKDQAREIRNELRRESENIDVHLIDIFEALPTWAALLNPVRRNQFGLDVSNILRDEMHRTEVANQAADLWNELEE